MGKVVGLAPKKRQEGAEGRGLMEKEGGKRKKERRKEGCWDQEANVRTVLSMGHPRIKRQSLDKGLPVMISL